MAKNFSKASGYLEFSLPQPVSMCRAADISMQGPESYRTVPRHVSRQVWWRLGASAPGVLYRRSVKGSRAARPGSVAGVVGSFRRKWAPKVGVVRRDPPKIGFAANPPPEAPIYVMLRALSAHFRPTFPTTTAPDHGLGALHLRKEPSEHTPQKFLMKRYPRP